MPRLQRRKISEVSEYEPILKNLGELFGFLPNDYLTMGHRPGVMKAMAELTTAVMFSEGKTTIHSHLLEVGNHARAI